MNMSFSEDLDPLHDLADEIRDAWSAEGHQIAEALDRHAAFGDDGTARSALARSLLKDLIRRSASRCSVWVSDGNATAVEVMAMAGGVLLRLRVRRVHRDGHGRLAVIASDVPPMDEAAIPEEFWVFGFDIDDDCALTDLCIAKVLGQTDRKVPMFVLGPEIPLGHAVVPPPNGTFMPDDEDLDEALDGLDDDGDEMAPGA